MCDKIKITWLMLHRHMLSKYMLYLTMGLLFGIVVNRIWEHLFPPGPPVVAVMEAPVVEQFGDYFGIYIDRTRNRLCQVDATQIIFRRVNYQGHDVDIVLPLPQTGLYWPKLGRASFIKLVPVPVGLPPGVWMTQTIAAQKCSFWQTLFGAQFTVSQPIPITIKPATVELK
jgi:hypothetical protein